MDRPIDSTFLKRQRIKQAVRLVLIAAGVVGALVWLAGWIAPSVSRARVRIARVEMGPVEATITASGTVVPAFERVISSPISSRVLHILKRPGEHLKVGDPILELDLSDTKLALKKLDGELALKANQRTKLEIALAQDLNDLESQLKIKRLDLAYLGADSAKTVKMGERGLVSQDDVRQAKLALEKAHVEAQRLEQAIVHARQSMRAQLDGLALEINGLKNQYAETRRQLGLAEMHADQAGVLTWVVPDEGASVAAGEAVARVADLSAFRVEAKVSQINAERIRAGLRAKVMVNETRLMGTVTQVLPTLAEGVVTFLVGLDDPSNSALRSNLEVDVYPILDVRDKTLRIVRGPFINGGEGTHDVFVVRGDQAVKTSVEIGLSGVDFFEVKSGLSEGDEVIVSDMTDYLHLKTVAMR